MPVSGNTKPLMVVGILQDIQLPKYQICSFLNNMGGDRDMDQPDNPRRRFLDVMSSQMLSGGQDKAKVVIMAIFSIFHGPNHWKRFMLQFVLKI